VPNDFPGRVNGSITDKLRQLADLKASGVLTEKEFTEAKAVVLNTGPVVLD